MSTFIRDGLYMEGDMQYGDIEVPNRPNPTDTWDGVKWVAYVPSLSEIQSKINDEARDYLLSTDWIIAKISQAQLEGIDTDPLLIKYATELSERNAARARIV